ncbi:MAG: hypothetical protein P4L77_10635 [Sulfuriferula sp.]|nr:hypothetical protein [Sulfuriferula sp.]
MFMNQKLLDQTRERFRTTSVDTRLLGKRCEYYFVMRDIHGEQDGIGGVEGFIVGVRHGMEGQHFVDIAVTTAMPGLYVVSQNLSVWQKGESPYLLGCPLLFEYNCRTLIDSMLEKMVEEHKKQHPPEDRVRHLKLVPKKDN